MRFPAEDGHGISEHGANPDDTRLTGDLVVVRRDGTTTVLGTGYVEVDAA